MVRDHLSLISLKVALSSLPVEVFGRIWAVHLGHEMADERLLIESCVVGAQEVEPRAEQAMVVELQWDNVTN